MPTRSIPLRTVTPVAPVGEILYRMPDQTFEIVDITAAEYALLTVKDAVNPPHPLEPRAVFVQAVRFPMWDIGGARPVKMMGLEDGDTWVEDGERWIKVPGLPHARLESDLQAIPIGLNDRATVRVAGDFSHTQAEGKTYRLPGNDRLEVDE